MYVPFFFFCIVLTYGGFVGRFSCTETIVKEQEINMEYETCNFHLIFSKISDDGKILKKKSVLTILDIYHTSPTSLIAETIKIINHLNSDVVGVLIELDDKCLDVGEYFVSDVAPLLESTAKLIYEGDYFVEEFYEAHQLFGKSLLLFINKHKVLPAFDTEVILKWEHPIYKCITTDSDAKSTIGNKILNDYGLFMGTHVDCYKYIDVEKIAVDHMKDYGWDVIPGAFYRLNSNTKDDKGIVYKYEVVRFSDDGTERVTDTFINSTYEGLMKEVRSEVFTVTDDTYKKLSVKKKDKPYFVPVWYKKFGENNG